MFCQKSKESCFRFLKNSLYEEFSFTTPYIPSQQRYQRFHRSRAAEERDSASILAFLQGLAAVSRGYQNHAGPAACQDLASLPDGGLLATSCPSWPVPFHIPGLCPPVLTRAVFVHSYPESKLWSAGHFPCGTVASCCC